MRVKTKKEIIVESHECDNCHKQIYQTIYDEEKNKEAFDLCNKCLCEILEKTLIPMYKR